MDRKFLRRSYRVTSPKVVRDILGPYLGGRCIYILADAADGAFSLFNLRQLFRD